MSRKHNKFPSSLVVGLQDDTIFPEAEDLCARVLQSHKLSESHGRYHSLDVLPPNLFFTGIVTIQVRSDRNGRQTDSLPGDRHSAMGEIDAITPDLPSRVEESLSSCPQSAKFTFPLSELLTSPAGFE